MLFEISECNASAGRDGVKSLQSCIVTMVTACHRSYRCNDATPCISSVLFSTDWHNFQQLCPTNFSHSPMMPRWQRRRRRDGWNNWRSARSKIRRANIMWRSRAAGLPRTFLKKPRGNQQKCQAFSTMSIFSGRMSDAFHRVIPRAIIT